MKENEVLFFVKFGKKEHLKELSNGKAYFSNADTFIIQEQEQLKRGQADMLEGRLLINSSDALIKDNQTDEVNNITIPISYIIDFEGVRKMPIFCLTAGFITDCEYYYSNNDYMIKFSRDKAETIKEHFEDADSALLIETPKNFISSIINSFEEKCHADLIKYYNMRRPDMNILEYLQGEQINLDKKQILPITSDNIYRNLYCKDNYFIKQSEFRFIIPKLSITNPKIFDINKDFRSSLMSIDEFFDGVRVSK